MVNVLIIEDQEEMRTLFKLMLEGMGHHVESAEHGVDGLHQLKDHPDLVILDLSMPLASGDVVLGFIRSTPDLAQTKVIVVSALPDAQRLADQLGADACLTKPIGLDDLEGAVNAVLATD